MGQYPFREGTNVYGDLRLRWILAVATLWLLATGCSSDAPAGRYEQPVTPATAETTHDNGVSTTGSIDSPWLLRGMDGDPPATTPTLPPGGGSVAEAQSADTPTPARVPTGTAVPAAEPVGAINDWLAAGGWPEYLWPEARRVIACESGGRPGAVNPTGNGSYGLFQLWLGWFRYSGQSADDWADPVVNARAAYGAYQYSGGWQQWTCRP